MAEHITELSTDEIDAVSGGGFIFGSFNDFSRTIQTNLAIQPVIQIQANIFGNGGLQIGVPVAGQGNSNGTAQ